MPRVWNSTQSLGTDPRYHDTLVQAVHPILATATLAKPGDTVVGLDGSSIVLPIRDGHIPRRHVRHNPHTGVRESFAPLTPPKYSFRPASGMHRMTCTLDPSVGLMRGSVYAT